MLTLVVTDRPDSRQKLLLIGLTFAELDALRTQAGDGHITVEGGRMTLDTDVWLFAGEDHAALAETVNEGIGERLITPGVDNLPPQH
jgi:hypothetical protein